MTSRNYLITIGFGVASILLVIALFFAGKAIWTSATAERPHFSSGAIVAKNYDPAHTHHWLQPVYAGQSCVPSGNTEICTPRFIYVPQSEFIPDHYSIQIENCKVLHKDGTLWVTKQNAPKCFKKWVDVDATTYNSKATILYRQWEQHEAIN